MKVSWVELSGLLQSVPSFYHHRAAPRRADEPVAPELLQGAVDVDRRHSRRVPKLRLRHRHEVRLSVRQPDGSQAHEDLTEDVCDPAVSLATTDVDDPLPKHGRVDQRFPPKHIRDAWVGPKEEPNCLVRNEGDLAGNDRPEVMVHDLEMKALAGHREGPCQVKETCHHWLMA